MFNYKNFILAAITLGFFLGLGFSRGLLLQEKTIRINKNLSSLVIATDEASYFPNSILLELERYLNRRVELKVIGDTADLSALLSAQAPPHLIFTAAVNLKAYSNGELKPFANDMLALIHPDFIFSDSHGQRADILTIFWGYTALSGAQEKSLGEYLNAKTSELGSQLDEHSLCNWKIHLNETLRLTPEQLRRLDSNPMAKLQLQAHTIKEDSSLPREGTLLWQRAFAIPDQNQESDLSLKALHILLNRQISIKWLLATPAASALNSIEKTSVLDLRKPHWLRTLDLNKTFSDKICGQEWRSHSK